tara:strand:- start:1332 stop:2117 length:786 start_codon:yes stop_codon:yes gene_type:complete
MWMQVLAAAGFEPLGAAFPGRWKESIGDANPEGFFESRFRDGVYHATNPLPGGIYVHPDRVRDRAVKVFPFGVRRSHRAFLDRVVVTMRPCAEYVRSRARLYAMESAHRDQELGERVTPVRYVPAYLEWFFENLTLLGDLRLRRIPHRVVTYHRALRKPQAVAEVIRWLGGDADAGVAELRAERRTQVGGWTSDSEVPEYLRHLFDELHAVHDEGRPIGDGLAERLRAARTELLPAFDEARRVQRVDQRRWASDVAERVRR